MRYSTLVLTTLPMFGFFAALCAFYAPPPLSISFGVLGMGTGAMVARWPIQCASASLAQHGHHPIVPWRAGCGVLVFFISPLFVAAAIPVLLHFTAMQAHHMAAIGVFLSVTCLSGFSAMFMWAWRLERRTRRELYLLADGLHLM